MSGFNTGYRFLSKETSRTKNFKFKTEIEIDLCNKLATHQHWLLTCDLLLHIL